MNFFKRQFLTKPLWIIIFAIITFSAGPQLISAASWIAFDLGVLLFVLLVYWIYHFVMYHLFNQLKESNEEVS